MTTITPDPQQTNSIDSDFNPYDDPFTRRIAKRKARQLVGRYGYTESDRNDIEQSIYLRVLQGWSTYDPKESHHHRFITAVVERFVANIIRDRCAEKRYEGDVCSLSLMVKDADSESLTISQIVSNNCLDARLGRRRRSEAELARLRIDMQAVIDDLPVAWKEVLELRKTLTITEIAARIDVPRTTIGSWMQKIRERFADAGLADYFDVTSSDPR